MNLSRYFACLTVLSLLACQSKMEQPIVPDPTIVETSGDSTIKILALGDSYTKGESVETAKNFPNQLVDSLKAEGRLVDRPTIIAQTGWRTDQLQSAIASADIDSKVYDFVTLAIGVNNAYQNGSFATYKTQFEQLLQTAIARAGNRKERVIVVSIPDWAYTYYGQHYPAKTPAQISQELDQYNEFDRVTADRYGVHYVNITDISRKGLAQPNLVAGDGLHPSAIQYTEWVKLLLPVVRAEVP